MELQAVGLILVSALFHAVWNMLAKKSESKHVFSWWMIVVETIIYLPLSIHLLLEGTTAYTGWLIAIISGIIHFVYWMLLGWAYRYGDLSIVYPIARSAPLYVTLFAVLVLGDAISWLGGIGIIGVLVGVYVLSIGSLDPEKLIRPLSSFRNKGIIYAFLTALSVTAYSLIDKCGALQFHPILFFWSLNAVSLIPLTLVIAFSQRQYISTEWGQNKWLILAGSVLDLLSYSIIIFVMQTYQVSYIISIRQISVVFGVFFGGTLLKEKNIKVSLLSSFLIFAGILFISIA